MILITGGTGWLGKTAIKYLIQTLKEKEFYEKVIVFGSEDKILKIFDKPIKIHSLRKINNLKISKENLFIFHTAFLTKDKIKLLGLSTYIKKNLEIINCLEKFIDNNPTARVVYTSSGAVNKYLDDGDKENNLYGYLKLIEEKKLSKFGNCLVLRIYGLTGHYIHSPKIYALCDFISSGLRNKSIIIKSKGKVIRSYVSAETIIDFSFNWLRSEEKNGFIVDATNDKLDLYSLAINISEIIGQVKIIYENRSEAIVSDYSSSSNYFNKLLKKYRIRRLPINEQLKISIDGFKSNFKELI